MFAFANGPRSGAALLRSVPDVRAPGRDREWLVPVAVIVGLELVAWWVEYRAGKAFAPMLLGYSLLTLLAFGFVVGVRLLIHLRARRRAGAPVRMAAGPAIPILAGLQLLVLGSAAFSALKAAIPKEIPFWLDPALADAELWMFGIDPWRISHALLGWATPAIDQLYATFVPVHAVSVLAVLTARPSSLKTRALIALALSWLLVGIAGAYSLSSAGPIFYDRAFGGNRFAELLAALEAAPVTTRTADLLWHFHVQDVPVIGNGISAMPSMHVGLTLWLALVLKGTRFAPLAWGYFAFIWLGSVHLGWHYAADGLAAALAILLLWQAAPALSYRRGKRMATGAPREHTRRADA